MRARNLPVVLLVAALLGCGASPPGRPGEESAGPRVLRASRPVPGQYLVAFQRGETLRLEVDAVARELATRHRAEVTRTFGHALPGFAARMAEEDAIAMAADPRVAWVEEDGEVRTLAEPRVPWGLDRIDQLAGPLDGSYTSASEGEGVVVYVVDTGIRATHVELAGRVAAGFSSIEDGRGTADCNGHGTHVAGVIGGTSYGVARKATLVPVRVVDCYGAGTVSTVVAGIDWIAAQHAGRAVANFSLGTEASATLDDAVRRAIAAGVTFVVSAGNGGDDACSQSPSRVSSALTVGAIGPDDAQAPFSNHGTCVDLLAPGVNIPSSWATSDTATQVLSGTSMATPHVAGAAALYLATSPGSTPAQVASLLVSSAATGFARELGPGTPDRILHTGALAAAPPPPSPGPDPGAATCATTQQLLANGGFEAGAGGWSGTAGAIDASSWPAARTGRWKGWLAGYGSAHTDRLSQSFTVPGDACGATLSLWLRVTTEETDGAVHDVLSITLRDRSGAQVERLTSYSNLDASSGYQSLAFDLSALRGQQLVVSFEGREDAVRETSFLVDDVEVEVTTP